MSSALVLELEAVLIVASEQGRQIGSPSAHALLFQIAYRAYDEPKRVAREQLGPREMFRTQEELGALLGVSAKSVGRICSKLDELGLRVRRAGRTAAPYKAMIYCLPTVEEFARAFGFHGEQGRVFVTQVREIIDTRTSKGGAKVVVSAVG